jgi:hypothetical protein
MKRTCTITSQQIPSSAHQVEFHPDLCIVRISLQEDDVERADWTILVPVSDNTDSLAKIGAITTLWLSGKSYKALQDYDTLLLNKHNSFCKTCE